MGHFAAFKRERNIEPFIKEKSVLKTEKSVLKIEKSVLKPYNLKEYFHAHFTSILHLVHPFRSF